ncbi:MAG: M28 family peptidase [Planctomycetes bacterium]|nr:M28 family peptidase [Planctomycetota bacterium]
MKRSWLFLLLGCAAAAQENPGDGIRAENLRKHVEFLASPELKGRNNQTPEGEKAAQYVADQMKRIGLKPGGKDGYFHRFKTSKARGGDVGGFEGTNVVGLLEGTDLKHEYVVLNAHHDHLGVVKGTVRPGADDNASGVAMILELAAAFAKKPPRRSLLVVSFDCEEDGLVGSREFVAANLYDPATIAADVCFDLIGGDFYPWESKTIYALGTEYSPEIAGTVKRHFRESLQIRQAGVFLIEQMGWARSDYGNFRPKKIPFVFFTTGTPWYYHSAHDTPDKMNWPKMEAAGRYCFDVAAEIANAEKRPTFVSGPVPWRSDAELMRDAIGLVLASPDQIKFTDEQKEKGTKLIASMEDLLKKPALDKGDIPVIQQAMIWLFVVQAGQIKHKGK